MIKVANIVAILAIPVFFHVSHQEGAGEAKEKHAIEQPTGQEVNGEGE